MNMDVTARGVTCDDAEKYGLSSQLVSGLCMLRSLTRDALPRRSVLFFICLCIPHFFADVYVFHTINITPTSSSDQHSSILVSFPPPIPPQIQRPQKNLPTSHPVPSNNASPKLASDRVQLSLTLHVLHLPPSPHIMSPSPPVLPLTSLFHHLQLRYLLTR
jgi:hypothetical protein